ncbi:hypothetical protein [Streptomyces sp. TRM68367]|uniref:hypothetical protein n=1 Tax=Streptomyces sp. TRM68367 TaxID=2758415 RepID=UPI00165C6688|nr:hypothetical protein [Streptomyces sp. TRM68367]MBC9724480.1 hypothetical protein [Streptomyces sp. TRM68367]
MPAEHDGYDGADPLMSVITDEPLTEAARTDPVLLAEHRTAAADVALLRDQLGIIGRALGEPAAAPHPAPVRAPRPRRRRRPLALAFGTLAVACAGALVAGLGWLVVQAGSGHDDAGGASATSDSRSDSREAAGTLFGNPRYLACARLVAEGTVTDVQQVPGTEQERITLGVTRSYKPEPEPKPDKAEDTVTFVQDIDARPRLREGDRALVGIPRNAATPDAVFVGERKIAPERAWITRSLPESRTLSCA